MDDNDFLDFFIMEEMSRNDRNGNNNAPNSNSDNNGCLSWLVIGLIILFVLKALLFS